MSNLNDFTDVELDDLEIARMKVMNKALKPCDLGCGRLLEVYNTRVSQYCNICQPKVKNSQRYFNKNKQTLTDEEKARIRATAR